MAKTIRRGPDGRFLAEQGGRRRGPKRGRSGGAPAKAGGRWSAKQEETFFRELAIVCNVSAAMRSAGLGGDSRRAYTRRQRDLRFRAAWDEAIAESYALLELEMLERSRRGDDRPPPKDDAERKLRAVPGGLALQLLKMHRASARAARPGAQRPFRGEDLRQQLERRLSEISRRLGGIG